MQPSHTNTEKFQGSQTLLNRLGASTLSFFANVLCFYTNTHTDVSVLYNVADTD